jgi:hypothetical protein
MTTTDKPWPTYNLGQPEYLHAIGAFALNYNLFESSLRFILEHYAGQETARLLLRQMV